MTFNDIEFKVCPRCGVEPVADVMRGHPRQHHLVGVECPV